MTEIENNEDNSPYVLRGRKRLKIELAVCLFLILLAPVPAILAFYGALSPDGEPLAIWFQRSGAIVTICAVVIDTRLLGLSSYVYESGFKTTPDVAIGKGFKWPIQIVSAIALLITIFGTLIWGYGDLLF